VKNSAAQVPTLALWRSGDDWRALLDEINASGRVIAVVTVN